MLAYEGCFEKRAITLFDYTIDLDLPPGAGGAPIVPVTKFEGRKLDVPLGTEPLAAAAEHFVDCIRHGREPLTSGARSLRVVETLETADATAVRSGKLT
jgi:predicted dehydrogenase